MKHLISLSILICLCLLGTISAMQEEEQLRKAIEASLREEEQRRQEESDLQKALKESLKLQQRQEISAEKTTLADLPPELHAYIGQFLGSTIAKTIRNLLTLSQVSQHFDRILKSKPDDIARIIENRFGKENVLAEFVKLLKSESAIIDARRIIPFIKLNLVTPEDVGRLNAIAPDWVYYVLSNLFYLKQPVNERERNAWYTLVEWLLNKNILDPNKQYNKTIPLFHAVKSNDKRLWDLLVKYGADLRNPLNQEAVKWAKNRRERGWIK